MNEQALLKVLDAYAGNQRNSDRDEQIKEIRTLLEQSSSLRQEIGTLMESQSQADLQKARDLYFNQYTPVFDQAAEILTEFSDTANQRAVQQKVEAQSASRSAWILLIGFTAIAIVLTVVIVIAIRKSILNPINAVVTAYREIAKGNLGAEIAYEGSDEMGQMAELIRNNNKTQGAIIGDVIDKFTSIANGNLKIRVNIDYPGDYAALREAIIDTAASINNIMHTIDTAAEQVSIGSSQVAGGAQALAAGSTEQAATVEELSASVQSIAEQAAENSSNVKTANQFVEMTGKGVNAGNEHMAQLTEAMSEIGSASSQIASITKLIEDISFQTNILALNAAIEAARAGSAGKGFAVVADEVRSLAAKSAEAAKQTSELIENSVTTVSKGTQITGQTAKLLQDVGENAIKVTESFTKIEQASTDQAKAIEQIKIGLSQVSAVVQTNAATAEETSATSEEMSAQAATLREEVGKFKLDNSRAMDMG